MTEAEWLTATDPSPMLELLGERASDRKLRLFAVACCRRLWDALPEERYQHAVDAVEQYADGLLPDEGVMQVRGTVSQPPDEDNAAVMPVYTLTAAASAYSRPYMARVADYACYARSWDGRIVDSAKRLAEAVAQADLLRDIFGPLPFCPVAIDPNWRTSTVIALAAQMYEARNFTAMPVLADALQEAGCEDKDALAHCRGPGPHVRGCWVVDLVLGKE